MCVCVCVYPHAERSSHRTLHWPAVSFSFSSSSSFSLPPNPSRLLSFYYDKFRFILFFYSVFGPPLHTRNAAHAGRCSGQRCVFVSICVSIIY